MKRASFDQIDFVLALNDGARLAGIELDALGCAEAFRRPGEYSAFVRSRPGESVSLTVEEFIGQARGLAKAT